MPTGTGASRPGDGSSTPATLAAGWRLWRNFPGCKQQLTQLRRWLSSLLPPCPARDDLLSVATELGSNALEHTASGQPGGSFTVELSRHHSLVYVAVTDEGGPIEPRLINDTDGERGRGLLLVQGLSTRIGWTGDQYGRVVWAEVEWPEDDRAGVCFELSGHRDPFRDCMSLT